MDEQTFAWNTACRIAETLDGIKPEDISVEIETDANGVWITYHDPEAGYTFKAKWHDGESVNDLQWDYA